MRGCELNPCLSDKPGQAVVTKNVGGASFNVYICTECADILGIKTGDVLPEDEHSMNQLLKRHYSQKPPEDTQ